MLDGHRLHDHPAHRQAHDVGPLDAVGVEHGEGVVGHVAAGGSAAFWSSTGAPANDVDRPTSRLSKRMTWKPAVGEHLAPRVLVVGALAAEAVDEQQRRVGRVAERVVVQLAGAVGGAAGADGSCHVLDSGAARTLRAMATLPYGILADPDHERARGAGGAGDRRRGVRRRRRVVVGEPPRGGWPHRRAAAGAGRRR